MKLHERIFFFLLALLPVQLARHFWPDWSFVIGRRIDYLSPTIFLTDLLIVILMISWVCASFKPLVGTIRKKPMLFGLPFLGLGLLTVANLFFSGNHPETWLFWIKLWEYALLCFYILYTRPAHARIVFSLGIAALYTSLLALAQFFFQHSLGGVFWLFGERSFMLDTPGIARIAVCLPFSGCQLLLRPYATFPHPNVLAGFLIAVITILVGYLSVEKPREKRLTYFFWGIVGISFAAVIVTFSRSSWISGTLGLLLLYGVVQYTRRSARALSIPAVFFATSVLILMIGIIAFFPRNTDESVVDRMQLNGYAYRLWKTSPLTGIGGDRFLPSVPSITVQRNPGFLQPVHSIYLLLLVETGFIGIVAFFWLLFGIYRHLLSDVGRNTRGTRHLVVYGIALAEVLLIGLVDHYPITLQQGQLLLTLLIGITLSRPSRR